MRVRWSAVRSRWLSRYAAAVDRSSDEHTLECACGVLSDTRRVLLVRDVARVYFSAFMEVVLWDRSEYLPLFKDARAEGGDALLVDVCGMARCHAQLHMPMYTLEPSILA